MSQALKNPELHEEFAAIARDCGCSVLEADFRGGVLKIVLDHPDGVTLEHCQTVSKQASALLDVADWGPGRYTLEVTSPGLDRKLYGKDDYQRFVGETVRVTFHPEGGKKTVEGVLESTGDPKGATTVRVNVQGEPIDIPFSTIEGARLVPDFS